MERTVRKGGWTREEDQLLRMCIENYGEGKWHQIPERTGLNRCRKSCRMRWLNYLKPNIKRGDFSADEVDMIVRLHKLLGNRQVQVIIRWSLISGRLPGRTSNDVKNYWNTHLRKKTATSGKEQGDSETLVPTTPKMVTRSNIFRPRPRTLSKCFRNNIYGNSQASTSWKPSIDDQTVSNVSALEKSSAAETMPSQDDSLNTWWEDLLVSAKSDEECNFGGVFYEEVAPEAETNINDEEVPGLNNLLEHWTDFAFDADLWNLLGTE